MNEFEYLSDSSNSPTNIINKVSSQGSDCDSDSTIIEMDLDSITHKYIHQPVNTSEFVDNQVYLEANKPSTSTYYDNFSISRTTVNSSSENVNKYKSTNKITSSGSNFNLDADKATTSNDCRGNSYFSGDQFDPELESILKKYASPPLESTGANRNSKPKGIAASTVTSNEKNELIILSSDEDEDLPQIQIKNYNMPTLTITSTQTERQKVDVGNKLMFDEEDLPQFQTGTIDVDNEKISNKYSGMFDEDEDLPRINIKNCRAKKTTAKASERDMTDVDNDLSKKYKFMPNDNSVDSIVTNPLNDFHNDDLRREDPDLYKSPKKKRKLSPDKEKKKIDKAAQQAKKREEAERAKKLKQALLTANKNMKPEECMKFITVLLDTEIANEKYGGEVLNALQAADITYRLQSQLIPHTVTWNRKVETHLMDEDEQLRTKSDIIETDEILLIMNWKELVELVHSRSLVAHVKSLQSILTNKKLSLAIYGIENYFKYQKSQKQKDVRSEITQTSQKTSNKYDKIYKDIPKISKKQLELALTELQLLCCCCHRKVETAQDLGEITAQFTKSIAQAPYKIEKHRKQQEAEWYISGDNKDCVRVDKNGNGLQRLWQQQLTTFPLARLEHAEAIVAKYPSPTSLMEEYSRCTQTQGEKLIQDIPIRRAAGPLTTVRKIGPELSKKMYKFFTSTDGNVVL